MELKDLVQEVLDEISKTENSVEKREQEEAKVKEIQSIFEEEESSETTPAEAPMQEENTPPTIPIVEEPVTQTPPSEIYSVKESEEISDAGEKLHNDEENFLSELRERLLVIFEGFQSPNNQNVEAKLDLTLNFLEYLLAKVDARLEEIDSRK